MQIVLAQSVGKDAEICGSKQRRQPVPGNEDVDDAVDGAENTLHQRRAKFEAVVLTRHSAPPNGWILRACSYCRFARRRIGETLVSPISPDATTDRAIWPNPNILLAQVAKLCETIHTENGASAKISAIV